MIIEHIAIAANSAKESDRFFINLLGMEKKRTFAVSDDLMEQFFGVKKEHNLIRYEKDDLSVEVILTEDDSKVKDKYTHNCLIVDEPDSLIEKASSMGYTTIKVPRTKGGFYYFLKDSFLNLYEIKNKQ